MSLFFTSLSSDYYTSSNPSLIKTTSESSILMVHILYANQTSFITHRGLSIQVSITGTIFFSLTNLNRLAMMVPFFDFKIINQSFLDLSNPHKTIYSVILENFAKNLTIRSITAYPTIASLALGK